MYVAPRPDSRPHSAGNGLYAVSARGVQLSGVEDGDEVGKGFTRGLY